MPQRRYWSVCLKISGSMSRKKVLLFSPSLVSGGLCCQRESSMANQEERSVRVLA